MSLSDLFTAVADLKKHADRLDIARSRRVELIEELKTIQSAEEDARNAVEGTQKLVAELANTVSRAGGK